MQHYELMVAIRGSLIESEAADVYKELVDELKKHGAEFTYEESWGKLDLAYKIAHQTEAHYFVVNFNYDGANIAELEKFMQLDSNIIRSLVSKIEEGYEPFTREMYDAGVAQFYAEKQERQRQAGPKTRATTAKQLEEEMSNMKKKQKTSAEKVDDIINKDLSL